ncbi:hypothetical protein SAMN03159288_04630 [Rhizobium sp. NFACC06-2]|nr:hypothetical protein SAMN03159288_04630 [Rhizobium sp. NFACC06-2]
MYIGLPVFANRSMMGVLATMTPGANIATIMDSKTGLGQTGRSISLNSRGTVISPMAEPFGSFGTTLLPLDLLEKGKVEQTSPPYLTTPAPGDDLSVVSPH